MIVAIGIDTVDVDRIARLLQRGDSRFLDRVYTANEQRYCDAKARPAESYAARFAAKEAVLKCLGTGWADGLGFAQIEVERGQHGTVAVALRGAAAARAAARGIRRFHLSLTHTGRTATAIAIAEG